MLKGKNKIALLFITILAVFVLWLFYNNKTSTIAWTLRNFSINDTASIDKIILTNKTNTILLERNQSKEWKLNHRHTAYSNTINRLLYTLNKIDIKAPVSNNETEKQIKELINSGIRCEIYQHGLLEKAYYLSADPSNNLGTCMLLIDTKTGAPYEKAFYTYVPGYNGYLYEHYSLNINYWKDKTIFDYDESQIKSITIINSLSPDKSFELSVTNNKYQLRLLDSKNPINNIDTAAVRQYLTYFYKLTYEQTDTTKSQNKQHISTITVKDNNSYINSVEVYLQKDSISAINTMNRLFLSLKLPNGQYVTVKPNVFGKLLQETDYFIKK
jgi:hypothetical protein